MLAQLLDPAESIVLVEPQTRVQTLLSIQSQKSAVRREGLQQLSRSSLDLTCLAASLAMTGMQEDSPLR